MSQHSLSSGAEQASEYGLGGLGLGLGVGGALGRNSLVSGNMRGSNSTKNNRNSVGAFFKKRSELTSIQGSRPSEGSGGQSLILSQKSSMLPPPS